MALNARIERIEGQINTVLDELMSIQWRGGLVYTEVSYIFLIKIFKLIAITDN